jgi:hypothetical protein
MPVGFKILGSMYTHVMNYHPLTRGAILRESAGGIVETILEEARP